MENDELVLPGRGHEDAPELRYGEHAMDLREIANGCRDRERVEIDDVEGGLAEVGDVEAPTGRIDALVVEASRSPGQRKVAHPRQRKVRRTRADRRRRHGETQQGYGERRCRRPSTREHPGNVDPLSRIRRASHKETQ